MEDFDKEKLGKNNLTIGEKLEVVKDFFNKHHHVSLAKQCKMEYIMYSFFSNCENTAITRQIKTHFKSRDLTGGKRKIKKIEININHFFNETIYDLLTRGYELDDWN